MPELPEVETIRRQLDAALVGRKIIAVEVEFAGRLVPKQNFAKQLIGKKIKSVNRRAKLLYFDLDESIMLSHLKMTGKWLVNPESKPRWAHVTILLSGGQKLYWTDMRKFGYLRLIPKESLNTFIEHYGPEPLTSTEKELSINLHAPAKRTIKAALLNQEVIAGVGNIYADEACFAAGVLPIRPLGKINPNELKSLLKSLKKILEHSVKLGGTTADDYLDTEGKKGGYSKFLKVYGRENELCVRCKDSVITKIRHAGRGTHFCKKCQK